MNQRASAPLAARLAEAESVVREHTTLAPQVALVLGSGSGDLATELTDAVSIDYAAIPHFPEATAPSHAGRLHLGWLAGKTIAVMEGRLHLYEGHTPADIAFPVRLLARLGAETLILTNAAGGLNPGYAAGDVMLLEDHLSLPSLAGLDPLRGPNEADIGPRFVGLNGAYDRELREVAERCAGESELTCHRGCYGFVVGPAFETPAEVRFLRGIGADAVGMSTVPEVVAARHSGMRVLALSIISNLAVADVSSSHETNVEEVWDTLSQMMPRLRRFLRTLLQKLPV